MEGERYTSYQCLFFAWGITWQAANESVESMGYSLIDAQFDLYPHQVEAVLFACKNHLSRGVILADGVGLVLAQFWAEPEGRILIIVPANLRKQWRQEQLEDRGYLSDVQVSAHENANDKFVLIYLAR